MPPPRIAISHDQIDAVVGAFYAEVRLHPVLGPVFAAHVKDWPSHEAKIARFWGNALLHESGYSGSPMMAHRQAGDVKSEHFAQWLALFDETAHKVLPLAEADAWSAIAHRIGRALRMGVEDARRPASAVPSLF